MNVWEHQEIFVRQKCVRNFIDYVHVFKICSILRKSHLNICSSVLLLVRARNFTRIVALDIHFLQKETHGYKELKLLFC
jgi:hypothetical protein